MQRVGFEKGTCDIECSRCHTGDEEGHQAAGRGTLQLRIVQQGRTLTSLRRDVSVKETLTSAYCNERPDRISTLAKLFFSSDAQKRDLLQGN